MQNLKPVHRTKLRQWLGKKYFTLTRLLLWHFGSIQFADERLEKRLPYLHFSHKTPLYRELKDVEMQYQYNKVKNLELAVSCLDGIVINPGETFSYWKLIGRPSAKRGFVPGMVLYCGMFRMGIGGGLCQLSNLIYWMTLHTPLSIHERYRHSYDVFPDSNRTQPFGSGATCVYPYRDLMIKNNTGFAFQLHLKVEETHLTGAWLSDKPQQYNFEVAEREHVFKHEYWGGYSRHNILYRKRFQMDGRFIDEEYITENHALMMYSPFLSEGSYEKAK